MSGFSLADFLAELKKSSSKIIKIKVIPGARKNEIIGLLPDGTLKVKLTAPPLEGRANQALVEFLAASSGIKKSSVKIVAGEKSRLKLVRFF